MQRQTAEPAGHWNLESKSMLPYINLQAKHNVKILHHMHTQTHTCTQATTTWKYHSKDPFQSKKKLCIYVYNNYIPYIFQNPISISGNSAAQE